MRSLFWRDKKRLVEFSNHWNHWLGNFIWPRKKFYREKIDKTKRRMWYLIHWMWLPQDVCGVFVDRCRIFRKSSTWFRTRSRKYVPSSLNQTIDNGKYFSPYLYHCKKLLFYNNQREIKLKKVGDTIFSVVNWGSETIFLVGQGRQIATNVDIVAFTACRSEMPWIHQLYMQFGFWWRLLFLTLSINVNQVTFRVEMVTAFYRYCNEIASRPQLGYTSDLHYYNYLNTASQTT